MKKTKTRILTALLAIAISFTVLSLGSVNVFADVPDEHDIFGTPIVDLIPGFAYDSMQLLRFHDLPEESQYGTFIFLDSQLVDYNIVQALCEAYPDPQTGETGLATLYYKYGIQIFVHTSDWTFTNITMQATGGASIFDFSDQQTYEWLYSMIGQVAMCGMAILNMDYDLYNFLLFTQNAWNDDMPIYFIQRDPISYDPDGLKGYIYTINGFLDTFGGGGMDGFAPGE